MQRRGHTVLCHKRYHEDRGVLPIRFGVYLENILLCESGVSSRGLHRLSLKFRFGKASCFH